MLHRLQKPLPCLVYEIPINTCRMLIPFFFFFLQPRSFSVVPLGVFENFTQILLKEEHFKDILIKKVGESNM